jgi:uncharacterized protein (DUF1778 family)
MPKQSHTNLPVYLPAKDRALIEKVARLKGLKLGTYVRRAAVAAAHQDLAELAFSGQEAPIS